MTFILFFQVTYGLLLIYHQFEIFKHCFDKVTLKILLFVLNTINTGVDPIYFLLSSFRYEMLVLTRCTCCCGTTDHGSRGLDPESTATLRQNSGLAKRKKKELKKPCIHTSPLKHTCECMHTQTQTEKIKAMKKFKTHQGQHVLSTKHRQMENWTDSW